jgi:hypothetical protein
MLAKKVKSKYIKKDDVENIKKELNRIKKDDAIVLEITDIIEKQRLTVKDIDDIKSKLSNINSRDTIIEKPKIINKQTIKDNNESKKT